MQKRKNPQARLAGFFAPALLCHTAQAQDASTGAIRGTVEDSSDARIVGAQIVATNEANGLDRRTLSDGRGTFAAQLLSPGDYTVRVAASGMQTELQHGIRVEISSATQVAFRLSVAGKAETITVRSEVVRSEARNVDSECVSSLIDSRAITELPLASRRFTDLALLTPGVTQDPRGLTAGTNGDLSFGGVRGFQTSFLVDGADNNNAFFSQARGRYRAPYQFSDEVVSEFRVASNSYGAEHGRAGGPSLMWSPNPAATIRMAARFISCAIRLSMPCLRA
jgi:Carboxypeptidase regulatory-like domain